MSPSPCKSWSSRRPASRPRDWPAPPARHLSHRRRCGRLCPYWATSLIRRGRRPSGYGLLTLYQSPSAHPPSFTLRMHPVPRWRRFSRPPRPRRPLHTVSDDGGQILSAHAYSPTTAARSNIAGVGWYVTGKSGFSSTAGIQPSRCRRRWSPTSSGSRPEPCPRPSPHFSDGPDLAPIAISFPHGARTPTRMVNLFMRLGWEPRLAEAGHSDLARLNPIVEEVVRSSVCGRDAAQGPDRRQRRLRPRFHRRRSARSPRPIPPPV